MFYSLYTKLACAFLALVLLLAGTVLFFSNNMSSHYSEEVMQRLNGSVAMYVTGQQPLLILGQVDEQAMDTLAERAMTLNPSLEIYLLDASGKILSHRLDKDAKISASVSLTPVYSFLNATREMPIYGDDPRNANQEKVFSVSPILDDHNETQGYVYVVIGGQMYQQLQDSVMSSYTIRLGLMWMLATILATALVGCLVFFLLTTKLRKLSSAVDKFDVRNPGQFPALSSNANPIAAANSGDEIAQLHAAFVGMAKHINHQFDSLLSLEKTRKELVANVSHDLRTPLASMQGYIEALMIKSDSLNAAQRQEMLEIAYKHSQRLGSLINELFELAKLESGSINPKLESFSLLELIHDSAQEFSLAAKEKNIDVTIDANDDEAYVVADIELIQRVLQNLIDNAITHTSSGGEVGIHLRRHEGLTRVEVSDTGKGIRTHEIPYIFERFYQSQQQPADKIGTGLGLAIVKKILELHQCEIRVKSKINEGTSFLFDLPLTSASTAAH